MNLKINRKKFIAKIGGAAAFAALSTEAVAEMLEHSLMDKLTPGKTPCELVLNPGQDVRRGAGMLFDKSMVKETPDLPSKPTLIDFFKLRFSEPTVQHCLRSAHHALKSGQEEIHIIAALLHDIVMNLMKADHAWWGADLVAPYVDERVAWGIKYHQACRFYDDASVGYEVPEVYKCIFGENFIPEPYIQEAYEYCRKHKWYVHARMITVNDIYAFDPTVKPSIEEFTDIIARNFKQPKEGLGFDNSPSAHMWRVMINPNRPL